MIIKTFIPFLLSQKIAKYFFLGALISVITTPIYATTGEKPEARAANRGAILYQKNCVSCHGVRGAGGPFIPQYIRRPDYLRAPALNETEHAWHHTDENLIKTILEGSPRTSQMPAWKNIITKSDARDLVDYIKSLWGKRILKCQGPKHMSCMH